MKPRTRTKTVEAKHEEVPLDWGQCNFLENLLRCVLDTRSVPRESGVQFQISSAVRDNAICLVFKIDRGDCVIRDKAKKPQPRPDYLVAHVGQDGLILTIVELKGTELKNLEHGVEQIVALYEPLREAVRQHLPTWLKIHYQGVLLCAQGAQTPNAMIARERRLTIVPLRFHHKAELYPYVSRRLERTDIYGHQALAFRADEQFGPLEQILARGPEQARIADSLHAERFRSSKSRVGVYANFVPHGARGDYLALVGDPERKQIILGARRPSLHALAEAELTRLRLRPDGRRHALKAIDA